MWSVNNNLRSNILSNARAFKIAFTVSLYPYPIPRNRKK